MVLCRVVLGNVEVVNPGSGQYCPSSENFDCGVDDFQNPRFYIVWNMNINTHILPEYVVSFKASSIDEGGAFLFICCFPSFYHYHYHHHYYYFILILTDLCTNKMLVLSI